MVTLTFYLRASSRGADYPGRLCLRIIHRRRNKSISCPYRLYYREWDAYHQEVIINDDTSRIGVLEETSQYISRMQQRFNGMAAELSSPEYYSIEEVISLLCPPEYNSDSLAEYARHLSRKLETAGRERTARAYITSVNKLLAFTQKRDISFPGITPSLVKAFEDHLKGCGKTPNTISFYMRNLRAIYNRAVEEGIVREPVVNLFKSVFTGIHKTSKRALDAPGMRSLQGLKYGRWLDKGKSPAAGEEQKLYTSWRYFIFCFHARGMSFVDMAYLRKDNIRDGVIRYYRKKTGGLIEVKLTPFLQSVLDSFSREVKDSPYLFPVIRVTGKKERLQYETGLHRQNRYLKALAREAGIGMKLSTHVSRHSWASIAKSENLPLWVISEGLGHASEKVTYTYLAQLERSRLDRANEMVCAVVSRRAGPAGGVGMCI